MNENPAIKIGVLLKVIHPVLGDSKKKKKKQKSICFVFVVTPLVFYYKVLFFFIKDLEEMSRGNAFMEQSFKKFSKMTSFKFKLYRIFYKYIYFKFSNIYFPLYLKYIYIYIKKLSY